MKCKYCNKSVSFFKFFFHYRNCRQNRRNSVEKKVNRKLTVPSDTLIQFIDENFSQLAEKLSQNTSYRNVYHDVFDGKLSLEESIAVNDLFWCAHTPWYGSNLVPGWLYLGRLRKDDHGIFAICSDWRTSPPDTMVLPIDMVPAEILVEAMDLIGVPFDNSAFINNIPYQSYIEKKYAQAKY